VKIARTLSAISEPILLFTRRPQFVFQRRSEDLKKSWKRHEEFMKVAVVREELTTHHHQALFDMRQIGKNKGEAACVGLF